MLFTLVGVRVVNGGTERELIQIGGKAWSFGNPKIEGHCEYLYMPYAIFEVSYKHIDFYLSGISWS